MFVGHYGVAMVAKRYAPELSLGTLFIATQLMDIAHSALLLLGLEQVDLATGPDGTPGVELEFVPYSHSAPAAVGLALVAGVAAAALIRPRLRSAVVVAAVVASHYLLDLLVGAGIPLLTHQVEIGVETPRLVTVLLESALVAGGLWAYLRWSRPNSPRGRFGIPVLAAALIAFNVYTALGSAPDAVFVLALSQLGAYAVFAAAAYWLDRPRRPQAPPAMAR